MFLKTRETLANSCCIKVVISLVSTHRIKHSFETLRVQEQKALRENWILEYLEDCAAKMICLPGSHSGLTVVTIFFYTCFWIPFMQLKKALAGIISDVLYLSDIYKPEDQTGCNVDQLSLPVARFQDLQGRSCAERSGRVAETCSVCLVEFEDEDVVSQLSKCSHVFHMDCIEKWIERNNFTCPLCRSLFFNVNTCHVKCDDDFLPHSWQY